MNFKELFGDDRAVSPVIGVILMVAITVILAAVIGTFVLGLGDQLSQSSPTASFGFDYNNNDPGNDSLTVSHNGGDKIQASNVNASVTGAETNNGESLSYTGTLFGDNGEIGAGTTDTIDETSFPAGDFGGPSPDYATLEMEETTVRVVWSTPNSDQTSQLGKWSGPDA